MSWLLHALTLPMLLAVPAPAAVEVVPLRGLRAEVAALLVQGRAGGALPIAAAVLPEPAGGNGSAGGLGFLVELGAPSPEEGQGPLEIYAYAVDGAGEVVDHFAVAVADWSAGSEGLRLSGRLEVAPGEVSVRLLAWAPATRRFGMVVRRIDVGETAISAAVVEECPGWTTAGTEAEHLLGLSARPVLMSGERRRLSLGREVPPGNWQVRLAREAPGEAAEELVLASPTENGELEFVVPELPAGIYQLSVVEGESRASRPTESWLVQRLPPDDGGCRRSWPRVLRHARAGSPAEPPPPAAEPGARRAARRLAADYRALLGRLAAGGNLSSAAAELADLEALLVADDLSRLATLHAAELETARSLAARDPRCLLLLVSLHAEVYKVHHGAGRFTAATLTRRLAAAFAELAVEHLATPEDRALIAVAITDLAQRVLARRASRDAQRLLERALSLDPSQEEARLLLAVCHERKGRYDDAQRELEALVAANSAHQEARVRLAILLRRVGRPAQAEPLLRAVIAERPPAWLLSLGYQTLAQLLVRDGRLTEAISTLQQAEERLPVDQAIQVLLTYALDRSGERRAVREKLATLPVAAAGASPRYRYSDKPAAALGLLHDTLRQSITVRLPILAVALGAEDPEGQAP